MPESALIIEACSGCQQATSLPPAVTGARGGICRHWLVDRGQRSRNGQPSPRSPSGGTRPGIVGSSPTAGRSGSGTEASRAAV